VSVALDGNAIGGQLIETFGVELTAATAICGSCGAAAAVAETVVFLRGPGTVARCRSCEAVLIVLVGVRGVMCVDLRGIAALEPA
jgi:hypothetical protein